MGISSRPQRANKWEELRRNLQEPQLDSEYERLHRMLSSKPPCNESGVALLQSDLRDIANRTHQRLAAIRYALSTHAGYKTTLVNASIPSEDDHVAAVQSEEGVTIADLAADILCSLRYHPHSIVVAMHFCQLESMRIQQQHQRHLESGDGEIPDPAVVEDRMTRIAVTAIHRVLHPLSSDGSLTTALLLDALNTQVEKSAEVLEMYYRNIVPTTKYYPHTIHILSAYYPHTICVLSTYHLKATDSHTVSILPTC